MDSTLSKYTLLDKANLVVNEVHFNINGMYKSALISTKELLSVRHYWHAMTNALLVTILDITSIVLTLWLYVHIIKDKTLKHVDDLCDCYAKFEFDVD